MSKTRDTGYLANVIQVHDTGVRIMSGSTMLMAISSSGAVTITGEISGSDAANARLLSGTGSVGFTTTASFLAVSSSQQQVSASYIALSGSYNTFSGSASTRITVDSASLLQVSASQQQISSSLLQVSASYISLSGSYTTFSGSASTRITVDSASLLQVSSSQQQISASLLNVISIFATTGSNSFRANQSITGSLVVSSTITAQTLVVQTVTSSIVYSSGSNNFGNQLNNIQTFTGSVNVTGSSHSIFGNVGIGILSPSTLLHMVGTGATLTIADNTSYACGVGGKLSLQGNYRSVGDITEGGYVKVNKSNSTNGDYAFDMIFATSNYTAGIAERLRITSTGVACFGGNVCAPSFVLSNGNCITALRNTAGAAIGVLGFTSGSDTLFIKGGTSGAAASIQFQDTGGTIATFYNCKLGIGTVTPGTALEVVSKAADADRTIPHNVLTLTAEQGNAPYGFFGGSILFKNRSYTSGLVESARIRSVIYDDGAPANCGGGIWFETTSTPGGTLTPSLKINYAGAACFLSSVDGTIFNSTSNAFRFSGSNALSLVSLNSENVVKINAAGYWGVQLVGANDQGILINNTGNVGIGITDDNPIGNGGTYRNLLVGNGAGYGVFQGISTATATDSTIVAFSGGTTGASASKNGGSINLQLDATSTGRAIGRWAFYTNSATEFAERMRITSAGQVRVIGVGNSLAFDTDGSGASTTLCTNGQYDFRIYNGRGGASNIDVSTYDIGFGANGSTNRYRMGNGSFYPSGDNAYTLGYSGQRWSAVWSANGTIQTSDARQKKDIETSNLGLEFINKLRPVSYKWKVGKNVVTSDGERIDENGAKHSNDIITPVEGVRTHYGLIAQEVKEALGNNDFGGYIYDENTDTMALRYDQFIAPLIKAIQEQQCTINTLKTCLGIS